MSFGFEWRKRRKDAAKMPAIVMVEKATSDLIEEPDWAVNMDICDLVNSDLRKAQDVIKAVKKRLLQKSPTVRYLALMLLEMMIKNCGGHVHHQVVEYEVLHEMVKIALKEDDILVRDKILILLDAWQEAFGGSQGQYPQYFWAYSELKGSGIKFPPRSENTSPIFTPPITNAITNATPRDPSHRENSSSLKLEEVIASEEESLSLSDFQSIRGVMELLKDMLQAINENDCEALQDEVFKDLVNHCCSNQEKIMHFINSSRNEELLFLALPLNDDLQDLIVKYNALVSGQPIPSEERKLLPGKNPACQKKSEKLEEEEDEDENDGFTQLARRNSNVQHTSNNIPPLRENGFIEPSARSSTASGETSMAALSPSSSVSAAMMDKGGPDMVCRLSSLSISQLPQVPRSTANTPTSALPIAHSSPPSSMSSYNSSTILGSLAMPPAPNHWDFSTSWYSVPVLPVQSATYPHPHPINEGHVPYNEFATPWTYQSRPQTLNQVQQQGPENLSSYPPPPWETSPNREDDDSLPCAHIVNEPKTSLPLQLHNLVDPRDVTADSRAARVAYIPSHQMPKDQEDMQKDEAKQAAMMQQYGSRGWMEGCDPSRSQSKAGISPANF